MANRRKTSPIWNHFEEVAPRKAKCCYCMRTLAISASSIGSLSRHLKAVHPSVEIDSSKYVKMLKALSEDETLVDISSIETSSTPSETSNSNYEVIYKAFSSSSEILQYETLAVSVPKKNVFHVELNRPKKINTFNLAMWKELKDCFSSLSDNSDCRVIVLSGQGKHFTGGIELTSLVELAQRAEDLEDVARRARFHSKFIKFAQDGISALEECYKPVIAVVHNACVGAGVDLVTAADMRYCSEDAWFQIKEVDVGLAADVGTLQRFPKVVNNTSIARELCYTGRKFDADEALAIGLVSQIFPDKDSALKHVLDVAGNIALKSPVAVQTTKQSLVYSQSRPNQDGLEHIRLMNAAMNQGDDLPKAAMAQATKAETPEYENL